jgi:hypothetical protein
VVEWEPCARPDPDTADRVRIVSGDAHDHEFQGVSRWTRRAGWSAPFPTSTLAGSWRCLERWGYQGKLAVTAHSSSARKQLARDVKEGGSTAFSTPSRTPARRRCGACCQQREEEPVVEVACDAGSGCAGSWQEPDPCGGIREPSGMRDVWFSVVSPQGRWRAELCWTNRSLPPG